MKNALNIVISGPPGHYDFEENWVDPETFTLSGFTELSLVRRDNGSTDYVLKSEKGDDLIGAGFILLASGIVFDIDPENLLLTISTYCVDTIKVTAQP